MKNAFQIIASAVVFCFACSAIADPEKTPKEKAFDRAVSAYKIGYPSASASFRASLRESLASLKKEKTEASRLASRGVQSDRASTLQEKIEAMEKQIARPDPAAIFPFFDFSTPKNTLVFLNADTLKHAEISFSEKFGNVLSFSEIKEVSIVRSKVDSSTTSSGLRITSAPKKKVVGSRRQRFYSHFVIVSQDGKISPSDWRDTFLFVTGDTMKEVDAKENYSSKKTTASIAYLFKAQDVHDAAFPQKIKP